MLENEKRISINTAIPIRMPWEDGRTVPSQQLPHVLCGAGA